MALGKGREDHASQGESVEHVARGILQGLSSWNGFLAPKGTPKEIVDKLSAEIVKILALTDVKDRFAGGGVQVVGSSPAELQARVKDEGARFLQVVQKANMKPD